MQLPVTLSGYMALWNPWPRPIPSLGNLAQLVGWQGFSIENYTPKWRKQMKTEMWCRNVALIHPDPLLMFDLGSKAPDPPRSFPSTVCSHVNPFRLL